jgi:hypothetical protein
VRLSPHAKPKIGHRGNCSVRQSPPTVDPVDVEKRVGRREGM